MRGDAAVPTTVSELIEAYRAHCAETYPARPNKRSNTFRNVRDATRPLEALYAELPAWSMTSVELQAVRLYMIDLNLSRRTINDRCAWIRRMFRWARDRGWCDQRLVDGLAIDGLRKGRSKAKESSKRHAVSIDDIMRTLRDRRMSNVVKDMVRFQLRTGMRPAEVCELQGREIDTTDSEGVWVYRPLEHKMAYLERDRVVLIGARAQLILLPHLRDDFCFRTRLDTPYRIDSYRQEIRRACQRMRVPVWTPQQVRKRTGTEAAKVSVKAAQDILGHADERTTRKHYIDARHSPDAVRFAEQFG